MLPNGNVMQYSVKLLSGILLAVLTGCNDLAPPVSSQSVDDDSFDPSDYSAITIQETLGSAKVFDCQIYTAPLTLAYIQYLDSLQNDAINKGGTFSYQLSNSCSAQNLAWTCAQISLSKNLDYINFGMSKDSLTVYP